MFSHKHDIPRPAKLQQGTWLLLLFLLVGIVCPTACLVWFMNDAAQSQSVAARQAVLEAYRGQLRLVRDQVNSYWQSEAAKLDTPSGRSTPEDFARLVKSRAANSVILLRDDGAPLYPTAPSAPIGDPFADRPDWRQAQSLEERHNWPAAIGAYLVIAKSDTDVSLAARAAQGQIRGLLATQRQAAAQTILEYFTAGRLINAVDLQGRMIAADENLLALHLMQAGDPRRSETLKRLFGWVNNYRLPIPSSQRLFLMGELKGMGVKPETFPTYDAEVLAASALEAGDIRAGFGLESTRVPQLWKLTAKGGRAVGLIKGFSVLMAHTLAPSSGVSISLILPGGNGVAESIPAGPMLPGWQVGLTFHDGHSMDEAARQRRARYLWIGYLVIAALCLTGLVMAQLFRRQLRLARLKTDLVAAVSHELKTPLASMRLLVDSLLEDEEFDRRKTREYLTLLAGENLRLTRLIENFLTFSRLERNRQHFEFTDVQPATVVESAVAAVRERFEQPGCHLEVQVDRDLPDFHGDPDALVTVLINLLDNAYKYTRGEKAIALRAFRADDSIAFEVNDNGIGIARREHKRIFQRFYQVDRRLARETGGCGLGLAIVASIVRAHNGRVSVRSQPGEGSAFTVFFPIEISRQKAAA